MHTLQSTDLTLPNLTEQLRRHLSALFGKNAGGETFLDRRRQSEAECIGSRNLDEWILDVGSSRGPEEEMAKTRKLSKLR